jgi:hypothetical protein
MERFLIGCFKAVSAQKRPFHGQAIRVYMLTSYALGEVVSTQCWKVTSLLLSKYDLDHLSHPLQEPWCSFVHFAERFDDVFIKELLELAAIARVNIDVNRVAGEAKIVGSLIEGGKEKHLNFREACNKLIHANEYELIFDWTSSHPLDNGTNGYNDVFAVGKRKFKNPKICTKGKFRGQEWQATIIFVKFVDVLEGTFI